MTDAEIAFTAVARRENTAWAGDAPLIRPEPWMQDALCAQVDPEIFFPSKGEADRMSAAKKVCGGCPVAGECLEFALGLDDPPGVWGGLSKAERDRLKRRAA